jgi:BlaI family transcriptional regulator, penicillinase repressor
MASKDPPLDLSRRERQIMEVIYRLGQATAMEVRENLPEAPSATAVRTLLRILEEKGQLRHQVDGVRHVYAPVVPHAEARRSMLEHVVDIFFDGSKAQAMTELLGGSRSNLSDAELDRLSAIIDAARRRR